METTQPQPPATNVADKTVKGPKALFWYLTMFFALAVTAFNTGGLWFQYINKLFPQEVSYGMVVGSFNQSALKFSLASILVSTPLFFLFMWLLRKSLKSGALNAQSKIRVWTTYIILFLTIAIAVGDLITTVFRVLDGDYTLRFLFKALTILFIVSWIFIYYGLELKSKTSLNDSKVPQRIAIATIVILVVSFVGALFMVDSPALARVKAYDRTRVSDLQEIIYAVNNYYQEFDKLPDTLDDLKSRNVYLRLTDPQSGKPYEYKINDKQTYELCAEFQTSNKNNEDLNYYGPEFAHDQGRICFTRKAESLLKTPPTEQVPSPIR